MSLKYKIPNLEDYDEYVQGRIHGFNMVDPTPPSGARNPRKWIYLEGWKKGWNRRVWRCQMQQCEPYVRPCESCGEGFVCYVPGRKYCCDTCESRGPK